MDLSFRVSRVQRRTPGPRGPAYCCHKFLSNNEQRRVMEKQGGQMGGKQCATPMGHSCPTKSKCTSPRDYVDLPTQGVRSPSRQSLPASIKSDKCPRPSPPLSKALLQKYTSFGQSEHACHSFPERKILLQKKRIPCI